MADHPGARPEFGPRFLEGVEHFNAREFWDAHESWEELWLAASSDLEQYLQGLIQLAAAYHHLQRGTLSGGIRLFDAALRRLEPFAESCCGIERHHAVAAAAVDRQWAADQLAAGPARPFDGVYRRLVVIDPACPPPSPEW